MTSKLDTAGLVERLDVAAENLDCECHGAGDACREAIALIEALTQAAAPDMEPVAWATDDALRKLRLGLPTAVDPEDNGYEATNPLYSASQLSAVQGERDAFETLCDQRFNEIAALGTRLEAAEARVAELEAALTTIETELQSSIETHRFNARHMIAEDSLQDAWKMLDMACEQFEIDANSLEIPLRLVRATLAHKGEGR